LQAEEIASLAAAKACDSDGDPQAAIDHLLRRAAMPVSNRSASALATRLYLTQLLLRTQRSAEAMEALGAPTNIALGEAAVAGAAAAGQGASPTSNTGAAPRPLFDLMRLRREAQPSPEELEEPPPGLFYEFHFSEVPGLETIWEEFDRMTDAFPSPPLQEVATRHTPHMRGHWQRALQPPEEQLYFDRESISTREPTTPPAINILKIEQSQPLSGHVCDLSDIMTCKDLRTDPSASFNSSGIFSEHTGIAGPHYDWRLAFGQGWEMLNGKFQMTTDSTALNSALTYTDTSNTTVADAFLQRLLYALKAYFGPDDVAGGRGTYLYPPGGFHEWHTNQQHPAGWRMYLVKTAEDEASWCAFKDPSHAAKFATITMSLTP